LLPEQELLLKIKALRQFSENIPKRAAARARAFIKNQSITAV